MSRCTEPCPSCHGRMSLVGVASALLWWLNPLPSSALEFELGDAGIRLDTTLSQGVTVRVSEQDNRFIGTANGGKAFSVNSDDGNLNFKEREIGQNVSKFTSDLAIDYGPLSGFARFNGFLDWKQEKGSTARTPLSREAKEVVGEDLDVLDAYGTLRFGIGDAQGQVRYGKQVLNWGESTFIPNGISIINPFDITKLRTPGSEIREALVPINMASASISPIPSLTLEGFYQLNWRKFEVDPPGTFFSTNDILGAGGNTAFLGFGDFSDQGTGFGALTAAINADLAAGGLAAQPAFDSTFLGISRASDRNPDNDGQFGLALRLFPESLSGTEFGLYFVNYHSRLPIVSARTGSAAGVTEAVTAAGLVSGAVGPGNTAAAVGAAQAAAVGGAIGVDRYAQTANYFIEYPRNLQLYGVSFNTQLGATGWALQGEYSYKNDVPLQIHNVELVFAALTPLSTASPAAFGTFADNQVGTFGVDTVIPGFIERDVSQIQISATKVLGPTFGADTAAFVAEVGVVHVHDMPSKSTLRLNADGTNTSGNPAQAAPGGAHAGKPATPSTEFPDPTSWGYRLAASLTYNNALGAASLTPSLQFAHDVHGISPQPAGPFREGRAAVTLGLRANYLESWEAEVAYTEYFGAGQYNLLNDRDFLTLSLKYSF